MQRALMAKNEANNRRFLNVKRVSVGVGGVGGRARYAMMVVRIKLARFQIEPRKNSS